ncbi:MAG: YncE family protein [Bacteroidales bacterium]|nr:YncE family protein [Bacteroidales bacterium]
MVVSCLFLTSCREEREVFEPETERITYPVFNAIRGFYLLNEGNMGSNKATLDFFCYETGIFHRNIFASANPDIPMELGDVGNDLQIYGSRLYAVINASNKIEVMDAQTARRIGQINIPNVRYIRFHGGYAFATSYAGPVSPDPTLAQIGFVAKIDTATLEVVARVYVGFQPDELEILNGKIYVANSGGYMFPNYENTLSVICLERFAEIERIEVAINLHRVRADRHGNLWVTSRGDNFNVPSRLFWVCTQTHEVGGELDIAVSNLWLAGDSLFVIGTEFNRLTMETEISFGIIDVNKKEIVSRNFITDGTEQQIRMPYGIAVNPITGNIYVTDARNHVTPGTLFSFDRYGRLRWQVRTGDIPAHFVFLTR